MIFLIILVVFGNAAAGASPPECPPHSSANISANVSCRPAAPS